MRKRTYLVVAVLAALVVIEHGLPATESRCDAQVTRDLPCTVLFWNGIERGERHLEILTDAANINEESVKAMAEYYFAKYPEPNLLQAFVATDMSQIQARDWHMIAPDGPDGGPPPSATLIRGNTNSLVRYRVPGQPEKTIMLR